jgi:hypothetical protein
VKTKYWLGSSFTNNVSSVSESIRIQILFNFLVGCDVYISCSIPHDFWGISTARSLSGQSRANVNTISISDTLTSAVSTSDLPDTIHWKIWSQFNILHFTVVETVQRPTSTTSQCRHSHISSSLRLTAVFPDLHPLIKDILPFPNTLYFTSTSNPSYELRAQPSSPPSHRSDPEPHARPRTKPMLMTSEKPALHQPRKHPPRYRPLTLKT